MSQWKQVVELSMYNATRKEIDELFAEIEYMIEGNKMELALRKASLVSDLFGPGSDKAYKAERMIYLIAKIPYVSQGITKLGLVTIKNFIISLTKEGDYKINPGELKSLAQIINKLTRWTDYVMSLSDTAIPAISNRMLEQMA